MGWQLHNYWREQRRWWEQRNLPNWKAWASEQLEMERMEERHPGSCFDDSPVLTSLEYLTAWRRL